MTSILRNILAIVIGLALGAAVNMLLITLGPILIPPPAGVDVTDIESISAAMHRYGPEQFIVPFLAHAVGTFVGALVAFLIAAEKRWLFAFVVGAVFLVGGISASFMLPAPVWFIAVDLTLAYFPMAWLATMIGRRIV